MKNYSRKSNKKVVRFRTPSLFIIKRAREKQMNLLFRASADNTGLKILYRPQNQNAKNSYSRQSL